jgi:hypothetical protein
MIGIEADIDEDSTPASYSGGLEFKSGTGS